MATRTHGFLCSQGLSLHATYSPKYIYIYILKKTTTTTTHATKENQKKGSTTWRDCPLDWLGGNEAKFRNLKATKNRIQLSLIFCCKENDPFDHDSFDHAHEHINVGNKTLNNFVSIQRGEVEPKTVQV